MSKFFEQWSCFTMKQKIFFVFRELLGFVFGIVLVLVFLSFDASASEASEPVLQVTSTDASCDHSWSTSPFGVCDLCGLSCNHPEYSSKGFCTTCMHPCAAALSHVSGFTHSFYNNGNPNGTCTKCGYECKHSAVVLDSITSVDELCHRTESHCGICGCKFVDNFVPHNTSNSPCYCTDCDWYQHVFLGGVCSRCGDSCSHSYGVLNGRCKICHFCIDVPHEYDSDSSECFYCYSTCQHPSREQVVICEGHLTHKLVERCTVCKHEFVIYSYVHNFFEGVCLTCDYVCNHTYGTDNLCTNCGITCQHESAVYSYVTQNGFYHDVYLNCGTCQFSSKLVPEDHSFDYLTGICTKCDYQCAHLFQGSHCVICFYDCEHIYVGNRCTVCGWQCSEGHGYDNGVCRYCGYHCQHSLIDQHPYSVQYDHIGHWEQQNCCICGIVLWQGPAYPHYLNYSVEDNCCKCSCGFKNEHTQDNIVAFSSEPFNPTSHKTNYGYTCCNYTFPVIESHQFDSSNPYTCTICGDYSIVAENYYDLGYIAGLGDGSKKDTSDLFSNLIFSTYDGMSTTFSSLLDYNVFGFNFAGFLFFLIALVIVFYFGKKVL